MNANDGNRPLPFETLKRLAWLPYDLQQIDFSLSNVRDALRQSARYRSSCAEAARKVRSMRRALRRLTLLVDAEASAAVLAVEALELPTRI